MELRVLKLLKFDVGRMRSVQMLEHASEILVALRDFMSVQAGKFY